MIGERSESKTAHSANANSQGPRAKFWRTRVVRPCYDLQMPDFMTREQRSILMSRIRAKNTRPEIHLRSILHRAGYRFRLHSRHLPGTPDIVLPRYRTAIFVHGCFWHGHDCRKGALPKSNTAFWESKIARNRDRDAKQIEALRTDGWRVHIAWECVLERTAAKILEELSTEKGPN